MTESNNEELKLAAVIKSLLEQCPNPGRLMEIYYWSGEHDLVEVMRRYISLPPPVRAMLHGFLMLVKDAPNSVTAEIGESGELTFSAPAAAELAKRLTTSPEGAPPILH